jgi:hypothetical protein
MPKRSVVALVVLGIAAVAACSSSSTPTAAPIASNPDSGLTAPADAGGTDATTSPTDGGIVTIATDAGTVMMTPLGSTAQNVGTNGGTVSFEGASLVVPAGAVAQATSITMSATSVQTNGGPATTVYQFGPEGLTFAAPATVNFPATAGVVHWSQVLDGLTVFADLPTTFAGGLATAQVTHFSYGYVASAIPGFVFSAAALGMGAIDSCEQIIIVSPGGVKPCPDGYWCGSGACVNDLTVGMCAATVPGLGATSYEAGGFPFICYPRPDAGTGDAATIVGTNGCAVCTSGYCAGACPSGETTCSGAPTTCVNLSSDPANCGVCGHACVGGQGCNQGTCVANCGGVLNGSSGNCGSDCSGCPGTAACGGGCAYTATDVNNCGACGAACVPGQTCTGGSCVPVCTGGGVCTLAGLCAGSCPTGSTVCGSAGGESTAYCKNLQTDFNNCGTCGHVCAAGQGCDKGTCAATCGSGGFGSGGNCGSDCSGCPGTVPCGSSCVDTESDPNNCGGCGTACVAGQLCTGGSCVPVCAGGGVCTASGFCETSCPAGSAACGTAGANATVFCKDLQTDASHCGVCGTACASGQACIAGACTLACGGGTISVGGNGSSSSGP